MGKVGIEECGLRGGGGGKPKLIKVLFMEPSQKQARSGGFGSDLRNPAKARRCQREP